MKTSSLRKVWFTVTLIDFSRGSLGRLCSAKDAWTEEEVKQIIQFLKQHGRSRTITHLRFFILVPVHRDEDLPHGVRVRAQNPDHPPPLCIWYIAGKNFSLL